MSGSISAQPPGSGFCRNCGVVLTAETHRIWRGIPHCGNCLEQLAGKVRTGRADAPQPDAPADAPPDAPTDTPTDTPPSYRFTPPPAHDDTPSPLLAFILGCVPGLGAVYNGQYIKGLIHILMLGSLVTAINAEGLSDFMGLFVPLTVFLVVYQPFEAMRTAQAIRRGDETSEFSGLIGLMFDGSASIGSSVLWIVLGVVFFLHALGIWEISGVLPFWPLLLIAFGVYRLFRSVILRQRAESERASEPSNGKPDA